MLKDATISGTPTTAGTYTFTVTVTTGDGTFASKQYTMGVNQCALQNVLHWSFQNTYTDDNFGVAFAGTSVPFGSGIIGQGAVFNNESLSLLTIQSPITQLSSYVAGNSISFAFWVNFSGSGEGFPSALVQMGIAKGKEHWKLS